MKKPRNPIIVRKHPWQKGRAPLNTRKNTLYNVAYRVFSLLLPLVTAPYLTRTVGQYGFGLYGYAWSISYMFCLVGMLGLENYGVRAIARVRDDQAQLDRTFSGIWRMQLLVAGVTLAAYLVYVFVIAGAERTIALALTMMSVSCLVNLDWLLMGLDQFKPIALRNTAVKLLAAACVFLFVRGEDTVWVYGLVWSAATLIGCLSCWPTAMKRVHLVPVSWREALTHLKPCAVLFISVIAVSVYRQMDKVMVGALSTMHQNGLYEAAEKIIYCLSGFISAIGTVMLPKVSNMWKKGEHEKIRRHIDVSMQGILCMVSAMAFGLAAVADVFTPLFYGAEFASAALLMAPLAFTLIMIGFANVIRTQVILPQGRDIVFIRSVVSGAVVNLAANALLIPRLGAMGAVVGTLLAEGSVPMVQWLHLRRELPYGRYLRYAAEYAGVGLAMLAAVRLLAGVLPLGGWPGLLVQAAFGAAVYGALCLGLWTVTKDRAMLGLLRRRA